ncbi:DUF4381 domain-containing protein [Aliiglaciecola aliphaticivorans]
MNPLDQLADIQLPQEVSIWPLAWGWWISAIFVLIAVMAIVYATRRYMLNRQAKKAALAELSAIDLKQKKAISQINIVLKRAALSYFPADYIAPLHGPQWSAFLISQLSPKQQQRLESQLQGLVNSLYQDAPSISAEQAFSTAKVWLSSGLPPKRKTNLSADLKEAANV